MKIFFSTILVLFITLDIASAVPLYKRLLSEDNVTRLYALSDFDHVNIKEKRGMAKKAILSLTQPLTHEQYWTLKHRLENDYDSLLVDVAVDALEDNTYKNHKLVSSLLFKGLKTSHVPRLLRNSTFSDYDVSSTVARAIARIKDIQPYLVAELARRNPETVITSAMSLSCLEPKDSVANDALYLAYLNDSTPSVKYICFRALWGLKAQREKYYLDVQLPALLEMGNTAARLDNFHYLWLLYSLGPAARPAIPRLIGALDDTSYKIKEIAFYALRETDTKDTLVLTAFRKVRKEDADIYYSAQTILNRTLAPSDINTPEVSPVVYFKELFHSNRLVALDSLANEKKTDEKSVGLLIAKLSCDTPWVRSYALDFLSRIEYTGGSLHRTISGTDVKMQPSLPPFKRLGFKAVTGSQLKKALLGLIRTGDYNNVHNAVRAYIKIFGLKDTISSGRAVEALLDNRQYGISAHIIKKKESVRFVPSLEDFQSGYNNTIALLRSSPSTLINNLSNPNSHIRGRAISLLPCIEGLLDKHLPMVFSIAQQDTLADKYLRHALDGMGPQALPAYLWGLTNGSLDQKKYIANQIYWWQAKEYSSTEILPAFPILAENILSSDKSLRSVSAGAARQMLFALKRDSANVNVDSLIDAHLEDSSAFSRLHFTLTAMYIRTRPFTVHFKESFLTDPDTVIRKLSFEVLERLGHEAHIYSKTLLDILRDSCDVMRPAVVRACRSALGNSAEIVELLGGNLIYSPDPAVRAAAIEVLSQLDADQTPFRNYYLQSSLDSSKNVSMAASRAIVRHMSLYNGTEKYVSTFKDSAGNTQTWSFSKDDFSSKNRYGQPIDTIIKSFKWYVVNKQSEDTYWILDAFDKLGLDLDRACSLADWLDAIDYNRSADIGSSIYRGISNSFVKNRLSKKEHFPCLLRLVNVTKINDWDLDTILSKNRKQVMPYVREYLIDSNASINGKNLLLRSLEKLNPPPNELTDAIIPLLNNSRTWNKAGSVLSKITTFKAQKVTKHWRMDITGHPSYPLY